MRRDVHSGWKLAQRRGCKHGWDVMNTLRLCVVESTRHGCMESRLKSLAYTVLNDKRHDRDVSITTFHS